MTTKAQLKANVNRIVDDAKTLRHDLEIAVDAAAVLELIDCADWLYDAQEKAESALSTLGDVVTELKVRR